MFQHDGYLNPPSGMSLLGAGVLSRDVEGAAVTWAVDATSGKGVPANATEWGAAASAAGVSVPSALWLLQEASGNAADSIGSNTLTASNAPTYQATVSGWSRKAIQFNDATSGVLINNSTIGNLTSTSHMLIAYVKLRSTPGGVRDVMGLGGGTSHRNVQVTTVPVYRARRNNDAATADGSSNPGTSVARPIVLKVDRSRSEHKIYTDQEAFTLAWANPSGPALANLGDATAATGPLSYLYAACFTGSAAELSDTQVRSLLQTLGWTIPW